MNRLFLPHLEGDPLVVTNRTILMIAVPTAFGFLTVPLVGLTDLAVIGQLGDAAKLGGIAIGAILLELFLTTFNFLRSGTSALTAQAYGRGDKIEQVVVLLRACIIAVLLGLGMIVLQEPLFTIGIWAMNPSDAVAEATRDYFFIRLWAAPFTLLNFVFLAWVLGVGRPILSFVLQFFLNGINIALTIYLVLGLGWDVRSAAWATFAADTITALVTIAFLVPTVFGARAGLWRRLKDKTAIWSMLNINRDIMIRSFMLLIGFAFFTRQSGQISDNHLAANEILLHLFFVAGYFLDGLAVAAEQFVGRAIGAKSRDTFTKAVRMITLWNVGQAIFLSVIFFALGGWLIDLMAKAEEVNALAMAFLPWAALTPIVGVLAFQMDGVFIGASWSVDMRNMMIASTLLFVAAYAVLYPPLGNHGLWLAFYIFLGFRGVSLWWAMGRREEETFS